MTPKWNEKCPTEYPSRNEQSPLRTGRWHTSLLGVLLFSGVAELLVLGRVHVNSFSKQNGAPSKTSRHFSISNYSQSESRMKTTYMKLHNSHWNIGMIQGQYSWSQNLPIKAKIPRGFTVATVITTGGLPNTSGRPPIARGSRRLVVEDLKESKISEHIICKES